MERVGLFFLHGFLGRPADWDLTLKQLNLPPEVNVYAVDYFHTPELTPESPFDQWGMAFNKFVRLKENKTNYLVGYSLGGRLALQAMVKDPTLWKQVACISTNPGFADQARGFDSKNPLREKRWLNDTYWAEQFRAGSWQNVIKAWNAQPVFGDLSVEPMREEKDYSREMLSLALTNWSLAQQPDMRPLLREWGKKFSWIVGADDQKFFDLGRELQKEAPNMQVYAIPGACHRVLFDKPSELAGIIRHYIK